VARGHPLERVGDEVARTALRLGAGLLLEHPHAAREVVADELLAALEQVRPRLLLCHACDPLELGLLGELGLLQLLLQLPEVRLAVGEALILAGEVDELPLDLLLLGEDALLDLQHRLAPVGELRIDLGPELDGLLARLDLRLPPQRLGLALGVLDQLPADSLRLADPGRAERLHREQCEAGSYRDPDGDSDPDQHVPAPPCPQAPDLPSRSVPSAQRARRPQRPTCRTASVGVASNR
jgi:hypothetical protein